MLSNGQKAQKDQNGAVITVKLARGSFDASNGPSRKSNLSSRRGSIDRSSISRATIHEQGGQSSSLQLLNQVGVIELLDQDERPTFIIDLGDEANLEPGELMVVFANASLRSHIGLFDSVAGKFSQDSSGPVPMAAFTEFKSWLTGFTQNHESPGMPLAFFVFEGLVWTCCTLRKRLRIIKGTFQSRTASLNSNLTSVGIPTSSIIIAESNQGCAGIELDKDKVLGGESSDYFENVHSYPGVHVEHWDNGLFSKVEYSTSSKATGGNDLADITAHQISGSALGQSPLPSPLGFRPNEAIHGAASVCHVDRFQTPTDQGFFDWTRLPLTPALPPHVYFARSVDWASTSLGPIEEWPSELRGMCNLIMASPFAAAMYWGPDLIAIYNESYIELCGGKHPVMMGQSYRDAWSEIWEDVKDVFANAILTGNATMKEDDALMIMRSGFLEETYFSWSLIPLVGEDGSVVGLYNPAFEKTRRRIAERRMLTLREVGEATAAARELKDFWDAVLKGLDYNDHDTPFVLLYSVSDRIESDAASMQSNSSLGTKQCLLKGSLGVPEGHQAAPLQIDLKEGTDFWGQVFRDAMKNDKPVLLQTADGTLDAGLLEGIKWRGFGDPCTAVVCCPIHLTTGGDSILGFLVMGVNPRRPYDDDYSLFVQLLDRQLATSMASVVLFEEEIARGERAARMAALDRIELSEQLAARTQEAVESETKFTRMAEFAPVGMFIADSEGLITFCNDTWYEISRVPRETGSANKWMDYVQDDDREMVKDTWSNVIEKKVPANVEFRFKAPWERRGNKGDTWVLASAYPEKDADGNLKCIFGSITNISQQKWVEGLQRKRMEEAVEMKRQQENFIDMTSHEMRNPLSAILQSADEISSSLVAFQSSPSPRISADILDSNIDAAQTITLCAQHQKRIVDDILTFSKLDSALLLVTPTDVQPVAVVQRALKMFDSEVQKAGINMHLKVDSSLKELGVNWVRLDPSRLLQVLINLTTNAIKFTTTQPERTVTVTLVATRDRPSLQEKAHVSYFPTRSKRTDLIDHADWGDGDEVFIHCAVQDTGRGLDEDEKKLLFQRFSQASPRTHVQYGGSGLGLFISRELVELQGGEIGVSSVSGKGSTFFFYIQARKSRPPEQSIDTPISMTRKILPNKSSTTITTTPLNPPPATIFKILIVEDNLVNQRVLQKQLRNLGWIVYVANHGGECIEHLQQSRFWAGHETNGLDISLILLDLEMPVMDGLTCARRIRELQLEGQVVRHVPIIAVTANARGPQIEAALKSGMVSSIVFSFCPNFFLFVLTFRTDLFVFHLFKISEMQATLLFG